MEKKAYWLSHDAAARPEARAMTYGQARLALDGYAELTLDVPISAGYSPQRIFGASPDRGSAITQTVDSHPAHAVNV